MWVYVKSLQREINLKSTDLKMAQYLITQYGGADGELSAALTYLNQRYTMPTGKTKGLLTDIGTEELGHVEMIATMVYQIMDNSSIAEIEKAGLGGYYADHGRGTFYNSPDGSPWTSAYISSKSDPITDLTNNMAAEQKARTTYEHLINLTDDQEVKEVLRFLREREVVHFQRFGEALVQVQDIMDPIKSKKIDYLK